MKRLLLVVAAFVIAFSGFTPQTKAIMGKEVSFRLGSDEVKIGTDILKFYQKPFVNWSKEYSKLSVEDRIMMSANDFSKLLVPVINVSKSSVSFYNAFISVNLYAGDVNSYVNTKPVKLFPKAEVFGKFLMLPLRQTADIFGCKMTYNQATGDITLTPPDAITEGAKKSSVQSISMQVTDVLPETKLVYGHDTYGRDVKLSMEKLGLAGIEKGKNYRFIVNSYFVNGYRYDPIYFAPIADISQSTITLWDGLSSIRHDGVFRSYNVNAITRNISGVWMVGIDLLPYYMTREKVSVNFDLKSMKMRLSIGDKNTITFETGSATAIWEKDGKKSEVKLTRESGFVDESFLVPLDFVCEVFKATYSTNGKSVTIKIPTPMACGSMAPKTLIDVTSVDEKGGKLEGIVLMKDKATVKFANKKLLAGKKPADLLGIDVFENLDENGQSYFQAFDVAKTRDIDPGSYGVHKYTCVGKDDFGSIFEENGKKYYCKNSMIIADVGDCVQVTGYTTKGMVSALDNSRYYDCKTGKAAETMTLKVLTEGAAPVAVDGNGARFELVLPQKTWNLSAFFVKDASYNITGFVDGGKITVKSYSRQLEQIKKVYEQTLVLFGYPESTGDVFKWNDRIYVYLSTAFTFFPNTDSQFRNFKFQDKTIRVNDTIYCSVDDFARLRNGTYTFDEQSGTVKISYEYNEYQYNQSTLWFTVMLLAVNQQNWSVKAVTNFDETVTLYVQSKTDLDNFKWGDAITVFCQKMPDTTYVVTSFKKLSVSEARNFYKSMASFTFTGDVTDVGAATFDVKDADGRTETFETAGFSVAVGQKVAVELINENIKKPVSVWQVGVGFEKVSQTVILDPNKLDAVMVDGVWKITHRLIPQVRLAIQSGVTAAGSPTSSCYQYRLGNGKLFMFLRQDEAIVNEQTVKLSQNQIFSDPFEYDQSKPPLDLDFSFKSLGIPYEIKNGKIEAKVEALPNPGSVATIDTTGIFDVSGGKITVGKKQYTLVFDSNQQKPADGQIIRLTGSITNFGPDRFFVNSFDVWERK